MKTLKEIEQKIRQTIENWKYERGEDVLASVLADEVISDYRQFIAEVLEEVVGRNLTLPEKYHRDVGNVDSIIKVSQASGYNHAKAKVRERINKFLNE